MRTDFWDCERISCYLKQFFNIQCPPSTVYAILKREKLITEENRKKLTKRHIKRYRRPLSGYLQMDMKYVPQLVDGQHERKKDFLKHFLHCRRCLRFFQVALSGICGSGVTGLEPGGPGPPAESMRITTTDSVVYIR